MKGMIYVTQPTFRDRTTAKILARLIDLSEASEILQQDLKDWKFIGNYRPSKTDKNLWSVIATALEIWQKQVQSNSKVQTDFDDAIASCRELAKIKGKTNRETQKSIAESLSLKYSPHLFGFQNQWSKNENALSFEEIKILPAAIEAALPDVLVLLSPDVAKSAIEQLEKHSGLNGGIVKLLKLTLSAEEEAKNSPFASYAITTFDHFWLTNDPMDICKIKLDDDTFEGLNSISIWRRYHALRDYLLGPHGKSAMREIGTGMIPMPDEKSIDFASELLQTTQTIKKAIYRTLINDKLHDEFISFLVVT